MTRWDDLVVAMKNCKSCLSFSAPPRLNVLPPPESFNPPDPKKILKDGVTKLLFVSEAPPGGENYGSFFWSDSKEDGLRSKLLNACFEAGLMVQKNIETFKRAGFYLLPTVPAACCKSGGGNGNPTCDLLNHGAVDHLKYAIEYMRPSTIFLLGESALYGAYPLFRMRNGDFRRDFEDSSGHLSRGCGPNSPYLIPTAWGNLRLFCSYWPRSGRNYRHTVGDLKKLRSS
jgi:hypothetical protein